MSCPAIPQPIKPSCEAIIDLFPEPFVIIDRNFQIVSCNQHYKEHYQVGNEEIIGKYCYEVSHRIDRPCSQNGEHCPLEEIIRTGKPANVMHIHSTHGHEEHVQITAAPIHDNEGNVLYMGETIHPLPIQNDEDLILVGRSTAILRLISILYRVAPTQSTVFLLGESGVGKDCAARYIHQHSDRCNGTFLVVDCGALGENLIESELFGYEKGAFTGANKTKKGLFEAANHGTLFIDEIGELPLHLQTKLLRVLETGSIRRIGGTEYIKVDVRIIAATNRDPQEMIKNNSFRQDLYYRLTAFPVTVPPLRERKDDIPVLAEFFLKQIEDGDNQIPLPPEVIEKLLSYSYPGNVRELRNLIERAVIFASGNPITPNYIVFEHDTALLNQQQNTPSQQNPDSQSTIPHNSRLTRQQVINALNQCGGHRSKAAQLLNVSERTIYRHIKNT
ncbi:MAG: sigma-54-dependent Fis family transcriptional regulator [Gammaproteobacteria bacterium]|nr:sigma-54-dependent Fis family transcriptional regulator [Gammaproteobacteria bacterium]MCW8909838.1 sigma-54-dependent Fis family transcriptional regulator [Gammaproteobacteria bacterium]MCW9006091.1 sigma-54-dependent Fis family transcriptional regulator [Gammaproteobacteria bacterium]